MALASREWPFLRSGLTYDSAKLAAALRITNPHVAAHTHINALLWLRFATPHLGHDRYVDRIICLH